MPHGGFLRAALPESLPVVGVVEEEEEERHALRSMPCQSGKAPVSMMALGHERARQLRR